jgi:hypothetical protein
MKKYSFLLLLLVSLLILPACGQNPNPSPVPDGGKKGTSGITLKIGEEIKLEKSGWTLRLNAVTADSRCPTTVECFHAGWVTVDISVEEDGDQTDQFLLTIPADREGQSSQATVGDTTIRLMEVNPYPTIPGGIPQDEYVVGLEVDY